MSSATPPGAQAAGLAPRGELVLVATPIGNLGDLSPRAEEVLRSADAIACEDTRHTLKLLAAKAITGKRLLAVHEHNEHQAAAGLVALIERGQRVALVTDAGTPAISDPGERVVAAVIAAGLPVSAVPGPAAFVVALCISGLPAHRFAFEGFVPARGSARRAAVDRIAAEDRTVLLYEAPHRIESLLSALTARCGEDRPVVVCRELTKRFETVVRGTLGEVRGLLGEPRGEYVVVLGAARPADRTDSDGGPSVGPRSDPGAANAQELPDVAALRAEVAAERAGGASLKAASAAVAARRGLSRKVVYDLCAGQPSSANGTES